MVILDDSESNYESSEEENSSDEGEENSMTYDSESGGGVTKVATTLPTLSRKLERTAEET